MMQLGASVTADGAITGDMGPARSMLVVDRTIVDAPDVKEDQK